MAVIQTGSIVSDIRGSVGSETYSRGQGGAYVRARAGPGGEPNANQLEITAAMTDLSQAWSDTLTEQQREDWQTYAKQFPKPNRWGRRTLKNGYNRFIGVNFNRYVENDNIATASPPTAPPIGPPDFTHVAATNPDTFSIPYPLLPTLPGTDTLWVFSYVGAEQNVGRYFYATPWTRLAFSAITVANWKANPLVETSEPAAFTTGKKIWLRIRVQHSTTFAISTPAQAVAIFDA